ncbi:MAG TPA: cytochrome c [Flavobacteriales bacterium]|nr:cytochrome c [Flavobacteriales bacterium]
MMKLSSKRIIFSVLCTIFFLCSLSVYLEDENVSKGAELITEEVKAGKLLFQDYNCTSCHQIFGLGGYMGPDLTNCMSAEGGPQRAEIWLRNGSQKMPNLGLTDEEINNLMAFLAYIDKSGTSPVREFKFSTLGTVDVKHY